MIAVVLPQTRNECLIPESEVWTPRTGSAASAAALLPMIRTKARKPQRNLFTLSADLQRFSRLCGLLRPQDHVQRPIPFKPLDLPCFAFPDAFRERIDHAAG